jgi:hypothetical protein
VGGPFFGSVAVHVVLEWVLSPDAQNDAGDCEAQQLVSDSNREQLERDFLPDQLTYQHGCHEPETDQDTNDRTLKRSCGMGEFHYHCQNQGYDLVSDNTGSHPPGRRFQVLPGESYPGIAKEPGLEPEQAYHHVDYARNQHCQQIDFLQRVTQQHVLPPLNISTGLFPLL